LRCKSNVIETACGSAWFDTKTHFCYSSKIGEKCGNRPESFNTDLYECKPGNKISLKTLVPHGGRNYEAVLVGEQTWMAGNLDYDAEGSVCYDNEEANCDTYGKLYNWETAIDICPAGWHLPSNEEWSILNDSEGISAYDFAKGGVGVPGGSFFDGIDEYGGWWSATELPLKAYYLYYDGSGVSWGDSNKDLLLSVRCVKD